MFPQVMEMKAKVNKWDYIKLKVFIQQRKLSTKLCGRSYLQKNISDKELICKMYKELVQLNITKPKQPD